MKEEAPDNMRIIANFATDPELDALYSIKVPPPYLTNCDPGDENDYWEKQQLKESLDKPA